ncbi:hypothetical protein N0V85_005241 [Neurospora sp. IMI 360204]|nr:hypothetical protein N0V85_005241 [Neurospora sp. IMI 360204]
MSTQELRQMGCTSVVTVPGVAKPMAAKSTSAVPRPDEPGVSLGSVLNEGQKMGKDLNKFASEFHSHAENTKTEIELLNDTTAQLEADFAKIQIQHRDLATSLEGHSEKLMSEIKELAQFMKAQSRTLSAVKTQVDRLTINFSRLTSAALDTAGTGEQRE